MKPKKGKKKRTPFSDSSDLSNTSEVTDESLLVNKLQNTDQVIPQHFTVIYDDKHVESKRIFSRNIIFIHSSVFEDYKYLKYVFIKGMQNSALCVPVPLKSIKRSTILFPKVNLGFKQDELVSLHPYTEKIKKATEVTISFDAKITADEDLKQNILIALMEKRFFYPGLKIKEGYLPEFCITKISSEEPNLQNISNLDITDSWCNSASYCCDSSFSLNKSSTEKVLPYDNNKSFLNRKVDQSSSNLESMFSSLNISETKESLCDNSIILCGAENQCSEFQMPVFFTTFHKTCITIQLDESEKTSTFQYLPQVGGLKREQKQLKLFINLFLGIDCSKGINKAGTMQLVLMLLGPPGIGKTLMLEIIHKEYSEYIEEIKWTSLYAKSSSEAQQELQQIFRRVNKRKECIILIDDFQYLCPQTSDAESRSISRALSCFIENCSTEKIVIVATINNADYDDTVLKGSNTIVKEINCQLPDMIDREDILSKLLSIRQNDLSEEEVKYIAEYSEGFTGRDLDNTLDAAETIQIFNSESSFSENKKQITFWAVKQALKRKKPSIVKSDMKIKEVKWSDIGGMQNVKDTLLDIVEGPRKHPELYKKYGITPSKGILLYGPPGCSKTMIAKALATECKFNFISKNVSDIHNKYVGESEKAVHDLFVLARAKSPCIIFLDEIDALAPGRGSSGGSGVEERIVNAFLQEMDGIEELQNVIILAATNRPDRLDEAFIRNGRINHFIYIPLPDINTREDIFRLRMKNRAVCDDFDYKCLASKTEGYTGAEVII
ncbi:ATPase family protein 2 homolog [Trichonephila inaurata madagascariensis]|uniref:ATPase family protein 2 homolog n=1 Tax=Trichonephila inaurata madagascariensis TaxID=2747483 RepID=A0A8X6ML42_9ARAC|nr:ATPase family protein 2 homolog [Trichonephila inaurata madagascariensis]